MIIDYVRTSIKLKLCLRGERYLSAVSKEIRDFDVTAYGGVDLERFGKVLVEHVIRHFGMMRYEKSGIKIYDISDSEMGILSDRVLSILKGVDPGEGVSVFRREIEGLLQEVSDLVGVREKGSVVDSLRQVVAEEVKIFSQEFIHFEGLWEL